MFPIPRQPLATSPAKGYGVDIAHHPIVPGSGLRISDLESRCSERFERESRLREKLKLGGHSGPVEQPASMQQRALRVRARERVTQASWSRAHRQVQVLLRRVPRSPHHEEVLWRCLHGAWYILLARSLYRILFHLRLRYGRLLADLAKVPVGSFMRTPW
eukprot:Skav226364  [mRNA]  locus=scaffold290:58026:65637:+ [translate_table: standard]